MKPQRIIRAGLFSTLQRKPRVPKNLKRYYERRNSVSAAIILENWQCYQGLTLEWAKEYAKGHRTEISEIRKEWKGVLRLMS